MSSIDFRRESPRWPVGGGGPRAFNWGMAISLALTATSWGTAGLLVWLCIRR